MPRELAGNGIAKRVYTLAPEANMDEIKLEGYMKAGRALARTREKVKSWVRPNLRYTELVRLVEEDLVSQGVKPSFPTNIDVNDVAAHYTPGLDDHLVIPEASIVKVDLGSHLDGLIADSAITVSLSTELDELVTAAEEALSAALKVVAPGVRINEVGRVVEKVLDSYGLQPISNLTGHSIGYYELHGDVSIPNVYVDWDLGRFQLDGVYAIEPFVTFQGRPARVVDSVPGGIYIVKKNRRIKDEDAARLLAEINVRFKGLPFAERWLTDVLPRPRLEAALRKLISEGILYEYATLVEVGSRPVAQAEHTFIVTKDGPLVTTIV